MEHLSVGFLLLFLPLLVSSTLVVASEDRLNNSITSGLFWSSSKDEGDLYRKSDDVDSTVTLDNNDEFDGGFSSLDGMLQWAIGHSDPKKLKENAKDVQRLSPEELKQRQVELKELMEKLKMPSDAQLMQVSINDLNNSSVSVEDRVRALEELLILVEPIDNANDFNKLGGLAVIIRELDSVESEIRKRCASVIGRASQNNPLVQKQALDLGALKKLTMMIKSSSVEEASRALYAVSALIRNNFDGQQLFYAEAGDLRLQELLSSSRIDIRVHKKTIFLVSDLALAQGQNTDGPTTPLFSNNLFLKSVVDLMSSADLDLQEKALDAVKNLLQLQSTEGLVFKEFCNLDKALDRMRQQLQILMEQEDQRDYAVDVETLRREVELIFRKKLEKGDMQVPT